MQIDAKLKHYKVFYQLFFYKLKTIKTHLRGGRNGPPSLHFKKRHYCNYVNTEGTQNPFSYLPYSFIIN